MTRSLLAGCTNGRRAIQDGLHKIVGGGEYDETDLGVLFPCKLSFDNKYSFLIQHDAKFRVTAIDGKLSLCFVLLCFVCVGGD